MYFLFVLSFDLVADDRKIGKFRQFTEIFIYEIYLNNRLLFWKTKFQKSKMKYVAFGWFVGCLGFMAFHLFAHD